MQNNNRGIVSTIENCLDMMLNMASLVMAYIVTAIFVYIPDTIYFESSKTMLIMFFVVILQSFVFFAFNLYTPLPFFRPTQALSRIIKANVFYYLIVLSLSLLVFDQSRDFVFIWMINSAIVSTAMLLFKKRMMIRFTVFLRKRKYALRKVIIVGDNTATAQEFIKQVSENSQFGMLILGYVGDKIQLDVGCDKLGSFKNLAAILDEYRPTDVVFAIDSYDKWRLIRLVNMCDDRCIKVYFLPVIYGFFKNSRQIEHVGSVPVINIHSTPLDSRFNAGIKRIIDFFGSLCLIILTAPIMIGAAIGVKLSSPGPIFFKQERVGKMGKRFVMLKFRSMKVNVKSDKAWTTDEDPRKTKFGNFIRKTSIDELPQLFNVLAGSMSLVGPRPEVPHFVEYFKERIPLYMVKHYVKPGMTGLAQVKGLRGDTSVEDRIHEDIEYIENWSLALDISILLKTPFKAINKNERYVDAKQEENSSDPVFEEAQIIAEDSEEEKVMEEPIEPIAAEAPVEVLIDAGKEDAFESIPQRINQGKKILYAASTISHINNFHREYIEALRAEGYTVKIMARGEGADFNIPFEKKFFSAANTACRAQIKEILAEERFDIIFLNTSLAAFHIRLCLDKIDRPLVVNMVHGYLFSRDVSIVKRFMLQTSERFLASRTDRIITMNDWDFEIAKKHNLAIEGAVNCRGMGAEVAQMQTPPEEIRKRHSCQDKFVLCFVGELSARKNQEFLICALNEIKEFIPNAVLWLVGDGLGREELERCAEKVDVSESVMFLGRREDACDYMRACDLYVSASTIEGMPFNLIEAMGCGKTVVASAVKGHTDLIEDGVSGFLYKAKDQKAFVACVKDIYLANKSLDSAAIEQRYRDFEKSTVFPDTLAIIKESIQC